MTYESLFFNSLVFTSIIEVPLVFFLVRFVFKYNKKKLSTAFILFTSLIASALTLPYIWFYMHPYLDARLYVLYAEIIVFIAESIIYHQILRIKLWQAIVISLVANITSYFLGYLF